MRKVVYFDYFADNCPFYDAEDKAPSGYNCAYPGSEDPCFCACCPLGYEAEQQDLTDENIDWDGLCEDGEVTEDEYLVVNIGDDATEDEKRVMFEYEKYIHRYDKEWLDAHEIPTNLAE